MQSDQFLLYGANGYTGELIARLAQQYQLQPILAGRNEKEIRKLASILKLPYRVIDLQDTQALEKVLKEVKLVLHAAGPFHYTAQPMLEACLATGSHYLDITGEIPVFEMAKQYNDRAVEKGIMLMPGTGFDVVPTDCLALYLKNQLHDAVSLQLAFASVGGSLSHGTASTLILGLGEGGAARKNGRIIKQPLGEKGMWVDFGPKRLFVMSIPWGDVSTAYFTTGINDIETYTGISPVIYKLLKFQWAFNWLMKKRFVKGFLQRKINKKPSGPTIEMRASAYSMVWGRVTNIRGEIKEATLRTPDGYTLTAHSSLLIVQKILNGDFKPGYQTPASVYGQDLVLEIPGSKRNPVF